MAMDFSYENLVKQENDLQFSVFNGEVALKIGMMLIERAKQDNATVAISITIAKQNIFHFAFDGLGPDADNWIRRKSNVVYEYHMSSLRLGLKLETEDSDLVAHGRSTIDFKVNGGSFPIIVKGAGVIGAITVTGLPHLIDHEYIVTALTKYLS